jgi:hypothetical protein
MEFSIRVRPTYRTGYPFCKMSASASQNLTSGAFTPVTLDTEERNTFAMWRKELPTRIYAPVDGWYRATGNVSLDISGLGTSRQLILQRFSHDTNYAQTLVITSGYFSAGAATSIGASVEFEMRAGDYITMSVFHDKGSALASFSLSAGPLGIYYAPTLSLTYLYALQAEQ